MTKPDDPRPSGMPDNASPTLDFGSEERAEQLVRILDQYLDELKAGKQPSREALLANHPELADQLNACLAGLEFIQGGAPARASTGEGSPLDDGLPAGGADARSAPGRSAAGRQLGDFRILREVGRGGMGAVYEAEQVSLGRRVALKVLRFAGVSDPEALDRFQREAETVARLHHTNIVPVFAVGNDQGVNYYAMQFIEGQSLADVIARSTDPLPVDRVTDWGLQAADALAHAHDRHVIHRDVKPSNLLIDADGRIWLTDFGLARRLDDVTLSMTGALLGTPRYMSPEQASATRRQIDRRTDIYSLGATLYELLTGQPAFQGDSPHQVIQQILTTEPVPLRQRRPDVPRDLETVVMKCLAKDVSRRYTSARELADDLRACLEQRPIRARRASLSEQAVRWLRAHRHTVQNTSIAVAATLFVVAAIGIGWDMFERARQSQLSLTTASPPLTAELLAKDDSTIVSVPVPTEMPVTIRGDDYRLRISATDRWDRSLQVSLPPGGPRRVDVSLEDQQFWPTTRVADSYALVRDGRATALIHLQSEGLRWESGTPKVLRWSNLFASQLGELRSDAARGVVWPWFQADTASRYPDAHLQLTPLLLSETMDIDGDALGDLILAARHQAYVVAVSGSTGAPLWLAALGDDAIVPPAESRVHVPRSAVLYPPLKVADQDRDQVADLLITWLDTSNDSPTQPTRLPNRNDNEVEARRWLQLLSGKTGASIWRARLPDDAFQLPPTETCPDEFSWFVGQGLGYSSGMSGGGYMIQRHLVRFSRSRLTLQGPHAYAPGPAELITVAKERRAVVLAGNRLLSWSLSDGSLVDDQLLSSRPASPGVWGDVDGDGTSDYVWRAPRPPAVGAVGAGTSDELTTIGAFSLAEQRELWTSPLDARFPRRESWTLSIPPWPVAVDLDSDGAAEIVVPQTSPSGKLANGMPRVPFGSLAILDGRDGRVRREKRIVDSDRQIDRFLVGPDIDGDGHRELFAATLSDYPLRLHVDCLSGATCATLWTNAFPFHGGTDYGNVHLARVAWWNAGEDGWPQLIILVETIRAVTEGSEAFLVSAGSGKLTHRRKHVSRVHTADADGDGVEDLLTFRALDPSQPTSGGSIDGIRGVAAEPWNHLGNRGQPAADFNRDGVRDLLSTHQLHGVTAYSGRTGELLWESRFAGAPAWQAVSLTLPSPTNHSAGAESTSRIADLDGDGVVDVLAWHSRQMGASLSPFVVLSGRTGGVLWSADEFACRVSRGIHGWRLADLDHDGQPELMVVLAGDFTYPQWRTGMSSDDLQWWLLVVDARSGKSRWRAPLSDPYGSSAPAPQTLVPAAHRSFPLRTLEQLFDLLEVADVNSDGTDDVVAFALDSTGDRLQLRAYQGTDGTNLWSHPLPVDAQLGDALFQQHAPRALDVDGDGRVEIALLEREYESGRGSSQFLPVLRLLNGSTGTTRAEWKDTRLVHSHPPHWFGERAQVSDLTVLRDGKEGQRLAMVLAGEPARLLVWNGQGAPAEISLPAVRPAAKPWSCDRDGDGHDEIAMIVNRSVWLIDPDQPQSPRWQSSSEVGRVARILAVDRMSGRGGPEIVVAREPGDNSVLALHATSGEPLWICAGPTPRHQQSHITVDRIERLDMVEGLGGLTDQSQGSSLGARADVASPPTGRPAPWILFQAHELHLCRRAVAWSERETQSAFLGTSPATLIDPAPVRLVSLSGDALVPVLPATTRSSLSPRDDPRWGRPFPWAVPSENLVELIQIGVGCAVLSLAMVVGPFGYVTLLVRHGKWSLRSMFVVPVLVGVAVLVSTVNPPMSLMPTDDVIPGPAFRWVIAFLAAPPVVLGIRLLLWCCTWQWRRAAIWVGWVCGVSLIFAIGGLIGDSRNQPPFPEEYYVWDGWYSILWIGFFAVSWPSLPWVTIADWWTKRREIRRANTPVLFATRPDPTHCDTRQRE